MQQPSYQIALRNEELPVLSDENLIRIMHAKAILKHLGERVRMDIAEIESELVDGESRRITNQQGAHTLTVSKSRPQPKLAPVDEAAIMGEAVAKGMEITDLLPAEGTEEYAEAVRILTEHAPHLLRPTITESDLEVLTEAATLTWQATGVVPAGWDVVPASKPAVTFHPTKVGKVMSQQLMDNLFTNNAIEGA